MYSASIINSFVLFETIVYSSFFPKEAVQFTKEAICNTTAHVMDVFYDKTTITTDRLLNVMYSDCATAPVLLNTLNESLQRPVYLSRAKLLIKVLILNSLDQVDSFMELVYEHRFRKDKRKYFVIVEWVRESNHDQWLYYLFSKFWRKQVLNVVVIFHKISVQMYTYRLLADEVETANTSTPRTIQEQNFNLNIMNITEYPTSKIFFNKLMNLQQRKLVVTMFPMISRANPKKDGSGYTGIDGNVAELIRSRMNATFNYITPKIFFNGSKNTGVVGDLVEKRAHFAFNIHAYAPYNFHDSVEQSNAYDHVKFCVIVPSNGVEPIAWNIFHSMSAMTWILVIGSIIFVIVAFIVVQRIQSNVSKNHRNYSVVEFTTLTLQSFFGGAIEKISTNLALRWVFIGWSTYSFIICNAFTATIISSLIKPNHMSNINTIEELGKSNLTVLYPTLIGTNIKNRLDNRTWNFLKNNLKEIESWERYTQIMNENKTQYAYIIAEYYCLYMVNSNIDKKTGESIYHMVPECLTSHPKVYLFQRGSMYLGYINELLGQFHEMGMFRYWIKDTNFQSLLKGVRIGNRADNRIDYSMAKVVITMEYLQTPFYMLGVGLLLSTLVFWMERWWRRRVERNHRVEFENRITEEIVFEHNEDTEYELE